MGEYPNSIWRLIRRLPTGDPSVIIGVVLELESIGDSPLVEVKLFMEMDFNQVSSDLLGDIPRSEYCRIQDLFRLFHITNRTRPGSVKKTLLRTRDIGHQLPMLSSEDISKDRTPNGGKTTKKRYQVEIVDFKCGNSDKAWSRPISDQFRKLSFSRLSD